MKSEDEKSDIDSENSSDNEIDDYNHSILLKIMLDNKSYKFFETIERDNHQLKILKYFAELRYSGEAVYLFEDMINLKNEIINKSSKEELMKIHNNIIDQYIKNNAKYELNLTEDQRKEFRDIGNNGFSDLQTIEDYDRAFKNFILNISSMLYETVQSDKKD